MIETIEFDELIRKPETVQVLGELLPITSPKQSGLYPSNLAPTSIDFSLPEICVLLYEGPNQIYTRVNFILTLSLEGDIYSISISGSTMNRPGVVSIRAYRLYGKPVAEIISRTRFYYSIEDLTLKIYIKNILTINASQKLTKETIDGINTPLSKVDIDVSSLQEISIVD